MPIVIKELFVSDQLSEALEKINFNFDQLLLAGGGPPGPQGPQGPQGVPGPEGDRGDHWFSSASAPTTDHGPNFGQLQINDHWVDSNGDLKYWTGSDWISSGINLKGPTGLKGDAGGSMELGLWKGGMNTYRQPNYPTVGLNASTNWLPIDTNKIDVDTPTGTNFLIPVGIEKNVLFLGNKNWARFNFNNFLGYNSQVTGSYPENTPKLTVIQSKIGIDGFSGIAIGAYGMTSGTLNNTTQNLNTLSGGWKPALGVQNNAEFDDARNMFYAGISINSIENNSKIKHIFKSRTMALDYHIQSGSTDVNLLNGNKPSIILSANLDVNILGISQLPADDGNSDLVRINIGPKSNRFRNPSYLGFGSSDNTFITSNLSNLPSNISELVKNNSAILGNLYIGETTNETITEFSINIGRNRKKRGTSYISFFGRGGSTDTNHILKISSLSDANYDDNSYISHTDSSLSLGKLYITSTNYINLYSSKKIEIASSASTSDIYSVFDNINKRFGVGVTSPLTTLHINGNQFTDNTNIARFSNSTNTSQTNIYASGSASSIPTWGDGSNILEFVPFNTGDGIISSSSGNLKFQTSNRKDRMWIDVSGNVGIGEKSTLAKLHVLSGVANQYTIQTNIPLSLTSTNISNNRVGNFRNQGTGGTNEIYLGSYFTATSIGSTYSWYNQSIGFIQSPSNLTLQPADSSTISLGKVSHISNSVKVHIGVNNDLTRRPEILIEGDKVRRGRINFYPNRFNPQFLIDEDPDLRYRWGAYLGDGDVSYNESKDIERYLSKELKRGLNGWIGYDDSGYGPDANNMQSAYFTSNNKTDIRISSSGWRSNKNGTELVTISGGIQMDTISEFNLDVYKLQYPNREWMDMNFDRYPAQPAKIYTTYNNTDSTQRVKNMIHVDPGLSSTYIIPDQAGYDNAYFININPRIKIGAYKYPYNETVLGSTIITGGFEGPEYVGNYGVAFITSSIKIIDEVYDQYSAPAHNRPTNITSSHPMTINSSIWPGKSSYMGFGFRPSRYQIFNMEVDRDLPFRIPSYGNIVIENDNVNKLGHVKITPFNTVDHMAILMSKDTTFSLALTNVGIGATGTYPEAFNTSVSDNISNVVKLTWKRIVPANQTTAALEFRRYVILLHRAAVGTKYYDTDRQVYINDKELPSLNANFCSGTFYMCRGTGTALPVFNTYKVNSMSSWNTNTGTLHATHAYTTSHINEYPTEGLSYLVKDRLAEISPRDNFLTIVTYQNEKWVALYPGYILQGHSVYFDGVVSDTTPNKTDVLKLILLEEVGLSPYNTSDPAKGWMTINEYTEIDWKRTAGNEVYGNRFFNLHDPDGMGTGESSQNSQKYPKFRGKYGETIMKSVLYADGYGFNWRNNHQRKYQSENSSTQKSSTKGHIGGIDYIDFQIVCPLRWANPLVRNGSYYKPWEQWPKNRMHPAPLENVPEARGIHVLNSMGVKKVTVHRGMYEASSNIGMYLLTSAHSSNPFQSAEIWNGLFDGEWRYEHARPTYLYFDIELNNYYGFEPYGYSLKYDIDVVDQYKFPFVIGPLVQGSTVRNSTAPWIQVNPESEELWDPWVRGTGAAGSQPADSFTNTRVRVHVPIWYSSTTGNSETTTSSDVKYYHTADYGNLSYVRFKVKLTWIRND